eukprot:CAMPEP_0181262902 /NCGR_PEP_ID=MMETSP1097-20121128/2290_1 /TAXON_ID=35684 /ORGANISM="Pseudopedinella elastica, Strain CCMP716" /LENGTH=115 /DNA_ID=CAMNT_0023361645 /DNA_START=235 /DNA_END=582 /DNA_ORIENTATION=-
MAPWIIVHVWYGCTIESLTDKVEDDRGELISFIVGLISTTILGVLLTFYTRRVLEGMIEEERAARDRSASVTAERRGSTSENASAYSPENAGPTNNALSGIEEGSGRDETQGQFS